LPLRRTPTWVEDFLECPSIDANCPGDRFASRDVRPNEVEHVPAGLSPRRRQRIAVDGSRVDRDRLGRVRRRRQIDYGVGAIEAVGGDGCGPHETPRRTLPP
jgi:hypothetical protein